MRKSIRNAAVLLCAAALGFSGSSAGYLGIGTVYGAERSGVVKATSVNVRAAASMQAARLGSLPSNAAVTVVSEERGSDGYTWYKIRYNGSATGYVRSDYVKFPTAYQHDSDFESQLSAQGFPESYKAGLRQLHAEFPNWTFRAFQTGIDWNTVLDEEMKGARSLVTNTSISSWKSTDDGKFDWNTSTWPGFDGASWVGASREITAYYLDPRNFLDETYIFQFESQKYNAAVHTADGVSKLVKGTFLDANVLVPDANGTLNADGTPYQSSAQTGSGSNSSNGSNSSTGQGTDSMGIVIDDKGPLAQAGAESVAAKFEEADIVDIGAVLSAEAAEGTQEAAYQKMDTIVSDVGPGGASASGSTSASGPGVSSGGPGVSSGTSSGGTTGISGGTSGSGPYRSVSYTELIMKAAQQSGVSPYVLAAMILQEQGSGKSDLISGTYAKYPGIYNYFNIGAYAENGMGAVERGLWYASQSSSDGTRPWNTIEKSIVYGAVSYGANYVNAGQDTFYLKKWNVQGANKYKHQYMTNVEGGAAEGAKYGAAYSAEMKAMAHEFVIPVYNNMPETACAKPNGDGNPNNKLSGITIDGFAYSPSFDKDTNAYTLIVDPSVSAVNVRATALNSEASISGTGNISLNDVSTTVTITVTAGNGTTRQYTLTINKQSGGAFSSGETAASQTPTQSTAQQGDVSGGPGVVNQSLAAESAQSGGSSVQIGVGPT